MSHAALCLAVRNRIRTVLQYANRDCEICLPPGMPPAKCGLWFVGVWGGRARGTDRNAIKRHYAVNVTLTMRVKKPLDQTGVMEVATVTPLAQNFITAPTLLGQLIKTGTAQAALPAFGFMDRLEAIADVVGKDTYNCHVMNAANQLLGDPITDQEPVGFRQPLRWVDYTEPRTVGPEWFWAEPTGPDVGVVSEIHFDDGLRIKNFANVQG